MTPRALRLSRQRSVTPKKLRLSRRRSVALRLSRSWSIRSSRCRIQVTIQEVPLPAPEPLRRPPSVVVAVGVFHPLKRSHLMVGVFHPLKSAYLTAVDVCSLADHAANMVVLALAHTIIAWEFALFTIIVQGRVIESSIIRHNGLLFLQRDQETT